ncbi:uncharacterized protein CcaverHIS019_0108550 [Cutaneotrichosporon cavernicola]|uniref:3-hydroxyisobutyrate dehydrogenase n=1 Tax=Cutaneotrichosporon cavernicola TaxID=279322 RepID=A0AA48I2E5_9TREE|nr:uncharacterized protein CcaverHIS019_0108550 [Cutaneotrichosporon cavernicola]BEI88137.1 hypothetical protein CcaverHIS019_0108550 [Cutaneotrichosporon cavernicola]BEI95907.1 hypothetical protein CcaverHIS631_0108560 [Cutaneotrichosporon cavernicola]BEJ03682.1 hypothetical protein CcaverHIS641_0108570 [Cutaneotrichosporon cavernicola]
MIAGGNEHLPANIGFIGLGAMGFWMAANLRQKLPPSTVLYINDVVQEAVTSFMVQFSHLGPVFPTKSAADMVANCDVIISIVPEGKHVAQIFRTDPGGALSIPWHVRGKLFIECSTIDIETSKAVAEAVTGLGGTFVDAPVSGGPMGSQAGTLTFMMGVGEGHPRKGEMDNIIRLMGKNLFACGGPTLGLATKVCNNYISGTIAIATSEGFNLAMKLGLDPRTFHKVLNVSTGGSWVNAHCNPVPGIDPKSPASNDYAGGFKVQFMRKDYNLAIEAAKMADANLYLGPAGLDVYTGAAADPACVDRDSRVVYRYIGGNEEWMGRNASKM